MTSHKIIPVRSLLQKLLPVFIFISGNASLFSQPGGKAFEFLEIPNSARVSALGGDAVALHDNDPDLAYHNPSLLNRDMRHYMSLNYVDYFAGSVIGYASAATVLGSKSALAGGIHYMYYGTFQGADELGNLTGKFRAADYSVNVMYSRTLDSLFTFGFTAKSIFSDYEVYNATALAIDAGISYHNPDSKFTAGLVLRNMGVQIDGYTPENVKEPLPFNIAAGITKGLAYAPLTFSVVFDHLEKWDLTYTTDADRDKTTSLPGNETSKKSKFDVTLDKAMRHVIIGTEVNIGNHLEIRVGYNYRRRQEMKVDTKTGTVGFSWGVGIKFSKFRISYGRSAYHLAGASNQFSFSMNLDEFSKKF